MGKSVLVLHLLLSCVLYQTVHSSHNDGVRQPGGHPESPFPPSLPSDPASDEQRFIGLGLLQNLLGGLGGGGRRYDAGCRIGGDGKDYCLNDHTHGKHGKGKGGKHGQRFIGLGLLPSLLGGGRRTGGMMGMFGGKGKGPGMGGKGKGGKGKGGKGGKGRAQERTLGLLLSLLQGLGGGGGGESRSAAAGNEKRLLGLLPFLSGLGRFGGLGGGFGGFRRSGSAEGKRTFGLLPGLLGGLG